MSAPDTERLPDAPAPLAGEDRGVVAGRPAAPPADEGGFLSRWSRRKRAAEAGQPLLEAAAEPGPPADLPDPASLRFDDDFRAYLGARVPAALKRAAMARLFADPHFNEMDGLDVYIEDYNLVPDLPAAERALLAHAREVLDPAPLAAGGPPPAPPAAEAEAPGATAGAQLSQGQPSLPQAAAPTDEPASAPADRPGQA